MSSTASSVGTRLFQRIPQLQEVEGNCARGNSSPGMCVFQRIPQPQEVEGFELVCRGFFLLVVSTNPLTPRG